MAEACVHRNTYEEDQAMIAEFPWNMLKEQLKRAGISPNQFKDYDEMVHNPRILSLLTKRHLGFDMAQHLQQPEPEFDIKGLEGFVAYGFKLKEQFYLPGVKIEYLGYMCNHCGVLTMVSEGGPKIQTITGRNDPLERALGEVGRAYPGEGVIYACGSCNEDMLVRSVKNPIIRKRDP